MNVKILGAYNLSGSVDISTESTITNLAITPQTLTYSASGTFTTLGLQNVTFTRTAVTPKWYGSRNITITGTGVSNSKVISPRVDIKSVTASQTAVVEVMGNNGRIWMDRNLGATRPATSADDPLSYGDLYQWGRRIDGHEIIVINGGNTNSGKGLNGITTTLSTTNTPGHSLFITPSATASPYDWRSTQNDNLWQGVNGINNPCPSGFRLPTSSELYSEMQTRGTNIYDHPLKFPISGNRYVGGGVMYIGEVVNLAFSSHYSTSTVSTAVPGYVEAVGGWMSGGVSLSTNNPRGGGRAIRCIKN